MANTMSGFLRENAKQIENIKFVLSDRFTDPDTNKPYEWEMRPLNAQEEAELRKTCSNTVRDRKGRITQELDQDKYIAMSVVKSLVFPDLNDAQLQDSYGVMGADKLLETMLLSAEKLSLYTRFNKLNKYDKTMEELTNEALD